MGHYLAAIKTFVARQDGAAVAEYALLVVFAALGIVAVVGAIGAIVRTFLSLP